MRTSPKRGLSNLWPFYKAGRSAAVALTQGKTPAQMAEKVLAMVKKGEIGEAYDRLF
jgi:hypothetical protein